MKGSALAQFPRSEPELMRVRTGEAGGIAPEQIRRASLLYSGSQVEVLQEGWAAANYPGYTFLSLAARANETQPLPDAADTVVKLELR